MSKRLGRVLASLVEGLSAVEKPARRAATRLVAARLLEQRQTVATPHGELVFVAGHPQAFDQARQFATREPETLAWIDGFAAPAVFWDIGANIGLYALYAGLHPGIAVLAFEPAAANFAALCRNIAESGLSETVAAYCIALGERVALGRLNLSADNPGSVYHAFETTMDCFGRPLAVVASQAVPGFSIDGFRDTFALPAPNYLKIDVDSIEEAILAGAARTLLAPELRSVLIELEEADTARSRRLAATLAAAGFELRERSGGGRGGSVNGIFTRV